MKTYKLRNPYSGENENIQFSKSTYQTKYGGGLAIQMWCDDGPYATLTVNLHPKKCEKNRAFIDVNNLGYGILGWLEKNKIASQTFRLERSGFCEYPEVEFSEEFLESI